MQILTEKHSLDGLAELGECSVGRVLKLTPGEAFEDRVRIRRAQPEGCSILDHLLVLLADKVPPNRPLQDGLQMGIGIRVAGEGPVELLAVDAFEPGQQMKPQQMAKRKSYLALPPTIDVVFLHLHLRAMT